MSDNACRYHAVRTALKQLYPIEPTGNLARHLNTLAGRTNFPAIAQKTPDGTQRESRVKRFSRWGDNERIE